MVTGHQPGTNLRWLCVRIHVSSFFEYEFYVSLLGTSGLNGLFLISCAITVSTFWDISNCVVVMLKSRELVCRFSRKQVFPFFFVHVTGETFTAPIKICSV